MLWPPVLLQRLRNLLPQGRILGVPVLESFADSSRTSNSNRQ